MAIGITMAGEKEVLGLWLAQTEGAKFWLQVVTELRNRGVQDIFIACVDGLKGFPEAIEAVFPKAVVQLCIVHMVRHSLNYVCWKRRKEVAADLKRIYQSATAQEAELRLGEFEAKWDADYQPIGQSWRRNWSRLTPFFDYPPEIRKVIYTTNAIESVNMGLRKLSKNRGSFPSDEALTKLFYLALRNISQKWSMPIRDWKAALNRFTIEFGDRIWGEHRKRKKSHAKALACAPKSRRAWVVGCGVRLEYSPTGRQTKRRKSVRVGSFPAFPDAIGAASMAST